MKCVKYLLKTALSTAFLKKIINSSKSNQKL